MYPDPANQSQPVSYNSGNSSGGNRLLIAILSVLLLLAIGFGAWAFLQMQDYKNNSDKKATAAVAVAKKAQAAELQAQFEQQSKSPNKTFKGSATYGSVTFDYPKTWSAYVDSSNSSEPINAYFHPNEVPGVQTNTAYALRVELLSTDYSQVAKQFDSEIEQGDVTAKAYVPPKLKGVSNVQPGTMFSGQINSQDSSQKGTILIIKVRDKTLQVSTESNDYLNDFNNTVLPSLSFAP
jgi:hypothetical protein